MKFTQNIVSVLYQDDFYPQTCWKYDFCCFKEINELLNTVLYLVYYKYMLCKRFWYAYIHIINIKLLIYVHM